jgi:sigma-B regulation protein RsbU (phosphoserine phosphatase)
MKLAFRTKLFLAFVLLSASVSSLVLYLTWREVRELPISTNRVRLLAALSNAGRGIDAEQVREVSRRLRQARNRAAAEQPNVPFLESRAREDYLADETVARFQQIMREIDRLPPNYGPGDTRYGDQAYAPGPDGYEKAVFLLLPTDQPEEAWIAASVVPAFVGRRYDMGAFLDKADVWNDLFANDEIEADEFNRTLTGFVPIRDDQGQTVAVLGIEAPADRIEQTSMEIIAIGLSLGAMAIVVAILLAWWFSRRLHRPVQTLTTAMQKVRAGQSDAKIDPVPRTGDEFQTLMETFNQTVDGLVERDTLRTSLEVAREIQQHLLPDEMACPNGLDLYGALDYCDETGGDYYDVLPLPGPPDRMLLAIGDVTGHGIGAALLMASGRAVLRSHATHLESSLAGLMDDINVHLVRDTGDARFITLLLAEVDTQEHSFRYASAGHDPALLYRAASGQVESLPTTGIPLGILEEVTYEQSDPIALHPGDVLALTTDGLREARNEHGEMFGPQRLTEALVASADGSARDIGQHLLALVTAFCSPEALQDDATIVVLKVPVPDEPG